MSETKRVAKASVNVEGTVLSFVFANGQTLTIDGAALDGSIREKAVMHGLEQKIRDSYAGADGPDEAQGLAQKVIDTLMGGEWSTRREGGSSEGSVEQLARAVVNAFASNGVAKDYAEILSYVQGLTKEQRAAIRSRESVAVELAKIKAAAKKQAEPMEGVLAGL